MTRPLAVLMLAALLLALYALMYAGWSRRARRHLSAAVAATNPAAGTWARPVGEAAVVTAEGTYVSTTSTASRLDRVAAAGLGVRARATMMVDRDGVTWAREGASTVRVTGSALLSVTLERGMAGKFVGQRRLVVVGWRGEEEDFATGFLPRYAADREPLMAGVTSLITTGATESSRTHGHSGGVA